jgi:hypothetical protein
MLHLGQRWPGGVGPPPCMPSELSLADAWSPPLVGRSNELTLLDGHLGGAGPPVLLLAGEPGIGKTRPLQETARLAGTQGWSVIQGGDASGPDLRRPEGARHAGIGC